MLRLAQPLTAEAQQGVFFAFPAIVAREAWVCQCRRGNGRRPEVKAGSEKVPDALA